MSNTRSRSRSPVHSQDEPYVINSRSPSMERSHSSGNQNSDSTLLLNNLPQTWNYERVKKFIIDNTMSSQIAESLQFVFIMKGVNNRSQGSCLVKFSNTGACKLALKQLSGVMCEGKRIIAMMNTANLSAIKQDMKYKKFEERNSGVRTSRLRVNSENTFTNAVNTSNIPSLLQPIQPPPALQQTQANCETYGLSLEFLNSLGIKLPLLNKIFVANLDPQVDETKLREVFSLAGQVLTIYMLKKKDVTRRGMAKIEFDHPVEAVQAISMLNGQELFNTKLIVQMDTSPQSISKNLPVGLNSIGPGLGPNSEPMRGVRNIIEFQPIKQLLLQEISKFKSMSGNPTEQPSLASMNQPVHVDTGSVALLTNPALSVQNPAVSMNVNPINPFNQTTSLVGMNPLVNNQATQNVQVLQGLLQQGVSADLAVTLAALQTQNLTQNIAGLSQNTASIPQNIVGLTQNVTGMTQNTTSLGQSMGQSQNEWKLQGQSTGTHSSSSLQNINDYNDSESNYSYYRSQSNYDSTRRNYNDSYNNSKDNIQMDMDNHNQLAKDSNDSNRQIRSDMLVFNNLPPSVTVIALSTKMREVGELKFAEMTGHGRAIVRFMNVQDAERCVKLFDRSKVDGQTIEVKFF